MGPANKDDFTIRASDGTLADPKEFIFPIFQADTEGALQFLGTGFFVTRLGWFATAKHIFLERDGEPAAGIWIIQFTSATHYYLRSVHGCVIHEEADVAIGICDPMSHKVTGELLFNRVATLSNAGPHIGEQVWTYAYPGTTVAAETAQQVSLNPNFYLGRITDYHQTGRGPGFSLPRFQTSMTLLGGSSGGPVFRQGGHVVGINSTGLAGMPDVSFVSPIVDIVHLGVPNVQLPDESLPRRVTIRDLIAKNYVSLK